MLYEIPQLEYVEPKTVEEAIYWLSRYGDRSKVLAGGTDLLGLIKDGVKGPQFPIPEVLVDISNIEELRRIQYREEQGLSIGAAVTLSKVENSRPVNENFQAVAQAARSVATPQIRNAGTIGGNLCQRPWCWYFRNPSFPCFKKGGKQCYAIPGEHKYYFSTTGLGTCVMSHPSDMAPILVALDASVSIAGSGGKRRTVPISNFFKGPKDVFENVVAQDELLCEVQIQSRFKGFNGAYVKDRVRDTWDLALTSAAVAFDIQADGKCREARICLGGVAPFPYRTVEAEKSLEGKRIDEDSAAHAADVAMAKSKPLPNTRYKVQIGRVIVKRAILQAAGLPLPA